MRADTLARLRYVIPSEARVCNAHNTHWEQVPDVGHLYDYTAADLE